MDAIAAQVAGVSSWNGRSGAVTMTAADVTGVGGALLASPTFTGTPAAPTATAGTNTTQLATTAFVQSALAAAPGGVSSFNTRTGAITLNSGDISAAGGALVASPTFTGTPAAPTASPGTSTTQLATTQFVMNALAATGGVSSFNGRAGAVTLSQADILGVTGGNLLTVADVAPTGTLATANQTLWWDSVHGQLMVSYNNGTSTQWVQANSPITAAGVAPGGIIGIKVFTATGTYTPTTGMGRCVVECVGGGGGGGISGAAGAGQASFGMGGGAGGYSRKFLTAAQVGASQAVTIGAGGAANGGTGGNTSFGTLCVANGAVGPTGGLAGTGDIAIAGDSSGGGAGVITVSNTVGFSSGPGAAGPWGGGAQAATNATTGSGIAGNNGAANSGGGGSGGFSYVGSVNFNGGQGGSGICIVTEYA
jgi:hypothetical protein